ncbi:hypothetical protein [Treponema sp.]|uniref:hypothetical protein n=1 Tax=Treponema sp. TaxID=166 RepID=UPI00388E3E9C
MKVTSKNDAWKFANLFAQENQFVWSQWPNREKSKEAGYEIYDSESGNNWLSDLGNRLEVNLENGKTISIWIEPEGHIEVDLTAWKSKQIKHFDSLESCIEEMRFWWASGKDFSLEETLLKKAKYLIEFCEHGEAVEFAYSGLLIKLINIKYDNYDRMMNRVFPNIAEI